MMKVFVSTLGQLAQNFGHLVRERARRDDAILRAFEFRSRDHFHGLRDLLRVLYRLDAPADVQKIRHRLTSLSSWCGGARGRADSRFGRSSGELGCCWRLV